MVGFLKTVIFYDEGESRVKKATLLNLEDISRITFTDDDEADVIMKSGEELIVFVPGNKVPLMNRLKEMGIIIEF